MTQIQKQATILIQEVTGCTEQQATNALEALADRAAKATSKEETNGSALLNSR